MIVTVYKMYVSVLGLDNGDICSYKTLKHLALLMSGYQPNSSFTSISGSSKTHSIPVYYHEHECKLD